MFYPQSTDTWDEVLEWIDSRPEPLCAHCKKQLVLGALDRGNHFPSDSSNKNDLSAFAMLWPCGHMTCFTCGADTLAIGALSETFTCGECDEAVAYPNCGHEVKNLDHVRNLIKWASELQWKVEVLWNHCPSCAIIIAYATLEETTENAIKKIISFDMEEYAKRKIPQVNRALVSIQRFQSLIEKLQYDLDRFKSYAKVFAHNEAEHDEICKAVETRAVDDMDKA